MYIDNICKVGWWFWWISDASSVSMPLFDVSIVASLIVSFWFLLLLLHLDVLDLLPSSSAGYWSGCVPCSRISSDIPAEQTTTATLVLSQPNVQAIVNQPVRRYVFKWTWFNQSAINYLPVVMNELRLIHAHKQKRWVCFTLMMMMKRHWVRRR